MKPLHRVCLLGMVLLAGCSGPSESGGDVVGQTHLTRDGLRAWRPPTGTWAQVGDAGLDPNNSSALVAKPGVGTLLNSPGGKTVDLLSLEEHGDVEVHVEFCVPKGSNSGVYLQGRYEVQVLDSFGKGVLTHGDCGGIYERWANNRGFEGHAPAVNASLPAGQWQSFDIVFRAPRFDGAGRKTENARFVSVALNKVVLHTRVEVTGPTRSARFEDEKPLGPLMLQGDHGPVAYRNIRMRKVHLE
jgi:hypothetical protein